MKNAAPTEDVSATQPGDAEVLREQVSALVDGELEPQATARLLSRVAPAERDLADGAWSCYHLIGEVLRQGQAGAMPARLSLVAGVMDRIAAEPVTQPSAPQRVREQVSEQVSERAFGVAANDAVFRWKMVAGLASLAAVAAVAWNVVGALPAATAPVLAQSAPAEAPMAVSVAASVAAVDPVANVPAVAGREVVVAGELGPVIRDARLEELMAAHRQFGSMSALQMPAGFLRNATFEAPQR